MTTEGKKFKKQKFGTSGGKTGENNPKTVFDPQKHRWVLPVGEDDIKKMPKGRRGVKRYHKEDKDASKRDYKEREISHETGKLVNKDKAEYGVKKWGKTNLRLVGREESLNKKLKKKWNVLRDQGGNTVYKMRGKNKIDGSELEAIIKEPKRGKIHKNTIFANAFVVDKKTGKVISNINLEIDGRGSGLFENGFDGCVRELQFNPKYREYLEKYMTGGLGDGDEKQAAKSVCAAILEEHGGPNMAEKQAVIMLKTLLENKYFSKE
jgi:hypothetical protein